MLRKLAALLLALVLGGAGAGAMRAAAASDSNAAGFVAKINAERRARGLHQYTVAADLVAVARRHTERMVAEQRLYHNPNLGRDVSGWQVVGENVGDGGSVDSLHTAFMNSPKHKANIVAGDYTQVGVATVTDENGVLWVTQVFRLPFPAPVVRQPTARQASRSVPRTLPAPPVAPRAPVAVPARPAPKKKVAVPLPVRPGAAAFVAALAPAAHDPFGQAATYADTMAALAR